MKYYSIAIDGPSGAGKSSLAKALAKRLEYLYVDTGAMYRAIGLRVKREGVEPSDSEAVSGLLPSIQLRLAYAEDGTQHIFLGDEDVSGEIRTPEIAMYASTVSAQPSVRAFLLAMQRQIAKTANVIMDGRDIGTVILPNADAKIFLHASPEARAQRRLLELREKGVEADLNSLLSEMRKRDDQDKNRAIAPAVPAEDAVMLDNSELDFAGTVDAALRIIKEKMS